MAANDESGQFMLHKFEMRTYRLTLCIAYLLWLYTVAAAANGFWNRYSDAMWQTTFRDARMGADVLGMFTITLGLAVAIGLARRVEWARVFGIMLGALHVIVKAVVPIFTAYYANIDLVELMKLLVPEGVAAMLLGAVTVAGLSRKRFKESFATRNVSTQCVQTTQSGRSPTVTLSTNPFRLTVN